ncbi:MAG: hypothetical protein WCT26_04960 [Candidatus Buchananbacteria bacterium]|jgi:hypothetical protein
MRTVLLVLGALVVASLTGCETTGVITVIPNQIDDRVEYFEYNTGTSVILLPRNDYYYEYEGRIHHVYHNEDVIINFTPPVYVIPGRIVLPPHHSHWQLQMNHSQPGRYRQPMMKPPRGGYGQPAIPNPNHRTDTRQRVPQEMKPPVNRQIHPHPIQPPQVRQQRRAPQQMTPPAVRQAPPRQQQQRVAPPARPMNAPRTQAPQRVMQKPVSRPVSRPMQMPQGGVRKR